MPCFDFVPGHEIRQCRMDQRLFVVAGSGKDLLVLNHIEIVHAQPVAFADQAYGLEGTITNVNSPGKAGCGHVGSSRCIQWLVILPPRISRCGNEFFAQILVVYTYGVTFIRLRINPPINTRQFHRGDDRRRCCGRPWLCRKIRAPARPFAAQSRSLQIVPSPSHAYAALPPAGGNFWHTPKYLRPGRSKFPSPMIKRNLPCFGSCQVNACELFRS